MWCWQMSMITMTHWRMRAQVFADSPNVNVVEMPINDGWTRDVSAPCCCSAWPRRCVHAPLPTAGSSDRGHCGMQPAC